MGAKKKQKTKPGLHLRSSRGLKKGEIVSIKLSRRKAERRVVVLPP